MLQLHREMIKTILRIAHVRGLPARVAKIHCCVPDELKRSQVPVLECLDRLIESARISSLIGMNPLSETLPQAHTRLRFNQRTLEHFRTSVDFSSIMDHYATLHLAHLNAEPIQLFGLICKVNFLQMAHYEVNVGEEHLHHVGSFLRPTHEQIKLRHVCEDDAVGNCEWVCGLFHDAYLLQIRAWEAPWS